MKHPSVSTLFIASITASLFFSCANEEGAHNQGNARAAVKPSTLTTEAPAGAIDTTQLFSVDDYGVTNEMLDEKTSNNSSYRKQSGPIHSSDKVWFTNDDLDQTLVFELYTDKHRLTTFHFQNRDIPAALIDEMELHDENGELAGLQLKQKHFEGFIQSSKKISSQYFTTDKGLRLGDNIEKVVGVYGLPVSRSKDEEFEELEWAFVGDYIYDGKQELNGKRLAKNSFGHNAIMWFKQDKLVAILLFNDMP